MKTIQYKSPYMTYTVRLAAGRYANARMAVRLIDAEDGTPIAVATVNMPEVQLGPDELIIKDYSENEGMLKFLVTNGFTSEPTRYVTSGYIKCPVVKYTGKLLEYCGKSTPAEGDS